MDTRLAQVDDLSELKVTLVALRLLERKQSDAPFITAKEMEAHPALREAFGKMLSLRVEMALRSALERETFVSVTFSSEDKRRYYANTQTNREMVKALQETINSSDTKTDTISRELLDEIKKSVYAELARLESVEIYPADFNDEVLVAKWVDWGYTSDEIMGSLQGVLQKPRIGGSPRDLNYCKQAIEKFPPQNPSEYYLAVIRKPGLTRNSIVNDLLVYLTAVLKRSPEPHEFDLLLKALNLFGQQAIKDILKQMAKSGSINMKALLPLLAESEDAKLNLALKDSDFLNDKVTEEIFDLYSEYLGASGTNINLVRDFIKEHRDIKVWRNAFRYAQNNNSLKWNYVSKLVDNPKSIIHEPDPINPTALFAFNEFRRRIGKGNLDEKIASEINSLATQIDDQKKWEEAIDNAIKTKSYPTWKDVKSNLTNNQNTTQDLTYGKSKSASTGTRKRVTRRPQVQYTDADREAARERDRKWLEEHERQKNSK